MSNECTEGHSSQNFQPKTIVRAIWGLISRSAWIPLVLGGCGISAIPIYPQSALASSLPSPSGTEMPSAAEIIDSGGNTWTFSDGSLYENGVKNQAKAVGLLLSYNSGLYVETTSKVWYSWNGSHWTYVPSGDPEKSPPVSPPGSPPTSGLPQKPITDFGVACNGTDQYANVQNAFNAAAAGTFELVVDCPVTINTARLPNKTVFIGSNTTVSFTPTGTFYVNNVLQPAFAIMNSSNIKLYDWNIVYTGALGVALADNTGNKFNDETATAWLSQNRHIDFAANGMHSQWQDTYNTGGMFFIVGEDSNILFSGFHITAETVLKAGGSSPLPISAAAGFVPCVFTFGGNWKSGTAANPTVPHQGEKETPQNIAGPTGLTFENFTLDGTIMGFVGGGLANTSFTNITSIHYADVMDVDGNHIGGDVDPSNNGPWTPPPHLFYLVNNTLTTPTIVNANLTFTNINDANLDAAGKAITYGPNPDYASSQGNPDRVGGPRDTAAIMKAANRPQSGYALSIKLDCGISAATAAEGVNGGCILNNYNSHRPDGFLAVHNLNNVTVENSAAVFDSNYTAGLPMYRPGIWFPGGYSNLTLKNVTFTDVAAEPLNEPIGYSEAFDGLHFVDVDAATGSKGVLIYVNALPRPGINLYDDNVGQTSDSTRYYFVGKHDPIFVGP